MKFTFFILLTLGLLFACSTPLTQSNKITDLSVAEFNTKMKEAGVVILDVRTPAETAEGTIPGAIEMNINDADFETKIKNLDQDKTYLVYCKAGGRSSRACSKMEEAGLSNLYNLKGGYTAWHKNN